MHHMLIYICDGLEESDLGAGGNCDNGAVSDRVTQCLASLLIAAWAVGGSVKFTLSFTIFILSLIIIHLSHY